MASVKKTFTVYKRHPDGEWKFWQHARGVSAKQVCAAIRYYTSKTRSPVVLADIRAEETSLPLNPYKEERRTTSDLLDVLLQHVTIDQLQALVEDLRVIRGKRMLMDSYESMNREIQRRMDVTIVKSTD